MFCTSEKYSDMSTVGVPYFQLLAIETSTK